MDAINSIEDDLSHLSCRFRSTGFRNEYTAPRWAMCLICGWLVMLSNCAAQDAADSARPVRHQVTGLFCLERVEDFRKVVERMTTAAEMPDVELVSVDFSTAEAIFQYDPAKVFPGATPEQIIERFDDLLRQASRSTFGIKPLCKTPREQLTLVEIPVVGLDCKACSLAAYEAVYKLEGVEQATASFKDGLVTAWIHPEKTDIVALEEALIKKNVAMKK